MLWDAGFRKVNKSSMPAPYIPRCLNIRYSFSIPKMVVFIQAVSPKAQDPLHAETQAMHLAAQVAIKLNLHNITFLTNNQTLSDTMQPEDLILKCSDWRIRHLISDMAHARSRPYTKIPIILNKKADRLAAQAKQHDATNNCVFSCMMYQLRTHYAMSDSECWIIGIVRNTLCTMSLTMNKSQVYKKKMAVFSWSQSNEDIHFYICTMDPTTDDSTLQHLWVKSELALILNLFPDVSAK